MSKHERQHSISRPILSETKRARLDMTQMIETDKDNNEKPAFSTCFLTDKILMPDDKKSLEKTQISRRNSCCSTANSDHSPCSHQTSLISLRSNVWTLLRMLLPQLSLYYPSTILMDNDSDHSIDRLVIHLIQIPSFHRTYPSI
ncbi:hypothetical protein I4U23_002612 [Adineta vaga]|nr:hypothetical protein I4U23_002612 [Adineta vaga]